MNLQKRIKIWIFAILLCFTQIIVVQAEASVSANISVSTTSTVIGNSGTATLTISSNEHIGQIYGTFTCGELGSKDLRYSVSDTPETSKSYTISWKASKIGTYTCQVTGLEVGTLESQAWPTVNVSSKTIKVIGSTSNKPSSNGSSNQGGTTADKKEYSSDNNLKSLEVEGQNITPEFHADTTEYKLTLDQSIEKININATANHEKATISGTGEKKLSPGENTIEVKVTAENGNEKIYKIIVTIEDLNPIKVKIGKKEYTVIKKNNDLLEKLEHYEEKTITIEEQEVIAYENKQTKVTLVILKNENNEHAYYVYNEKTKTYEEYHYITVGNITLQLLEAPETLENYQKKQITIQEETVNIYKIEVAHKVGLIYGTNVKTGNTSYYVYDQNEDTLSKYYDDEVKLYKEELKETKSYIMLLMGIVAFIGMILIVVSIVQEKKRRRKRRYV